MIQKTHAQHAPGIYALELESFSDPWSLDAILYEIENSVCLVAIKENTVLGHVTMRHILDEGHINNIAVKKDARQNGIGTKLLEALITEAKKNGITAITLEVRISNTPALSLYKKHSFEIHGYRKNYYSHPTEDAAIMWKKLF